MDTNSKTPGTVESKKNDSSEHIRRFKEFIESHYYGLLLETVRKGKKAVPIDFGELIKHDPEFAEQILEDPEDLIKACEIAIKDFDFTSDKEHKKINVRFFNLPSTQNMLIRNIRSEHIGRFIHVEGVVRQKSDVRPQVTTARFECPACGNVISVIQLDTKFKEPTRCGCGRKGKFFLLNKELVDAQGIVLEEASENLEGGEQPKRMNIFLKEDLVSPLTDKKTNPGTKINLNGYVKEVPISLNSGGTSTRYDLLIEANFVDTSSEEFSDIEISKEEEEEILELASNTNIKDILVNSVAPSIYGHERIKEALLYQMVSGVRKERSDGVTTRGDMHILLIGDPGSGKCLHGSTKIILSDGNIKPIKEIVKDRNEEKIKLQLPALNLNGKIDSQKAVRVWSRNEKRLLKLKTRTGKEIKVTKNHPLFTIDNGFIISKEANDFKAGERIIIPRKIDIKGSIQTIPSFTATRKSNNTKSKLFPNIVTKELSRLSGYLCGDGYLNYSKTSGWVSLTNNDKESLEDFSSLIYKLFKVKTSIRNKIKKETKEVYVLSRPIAEFFDVNFNEIFCRSKNKKIPELILKSDNEVLKEFIKSLFECDCHVNVKKKQIEFCSISKELIEQLQLVLLRYGIVSLIKKKRKFATNSLLKNKIDSYELIISGNFLKIFKEEIGLISERKNKAIQNSLTKKFNTNIDLVPNVNDLLKQKRIEYNLNQSQMGLKRSTYCHYEQNNKLPSFESFSKIAKHLNDPHLLTIANSNIFFDEILEINEIINDEDLVYDLEVSNVHNYIANAIVVHNSQLLKRMSKIAPKARFVSGKGASLDYKEPILIRKNNLIKTVLIGDLIENNCLKEIENKFLPMKEKIETLAFNPETLKLEWKEIKYGYRHKPKEKLFHIVLESGRNIKITKDHSVFMLKNGEVKTIEASKLKEKDTLLIPKKIMSDNTIIMPKGMATLLGYYIAEGHIRNKDSSYKIEFTLNKKETNIFSKINNISKNLFNKEAKKYPHGKNGMRIIIYGKKAHDILKKYLGDVYNKKAKTKKIPEIIFNASKKDKLDFINAYIEGDYGVTKSRYLMSDLIYLYLQLNKIAGFNEREDDKENIINKRIIKSTGNRYDLKSINKEYSKRYEKIPFEALDKLIFEKYCKKLVSNDYKRLSWDKLSYLKLIERIIYIGNKKIASGIELRNLFGESTLEYINKNKELYKVNKKGRTNYVSLTGYGLKIYNKLINLKKVFNSDFGFVRIKKIERVESSSKYVYDVSVPGYENFVGGIGGIICHNSGAGLCVSPSSKLLTNPGGIETIKETVDSRLKVKKEYVPGVYKQDDINDIKIQSMSNKLKIHSKNPKSIWKLKSPEFVYEINLSSGKKIELTGNTQLYTIEKGKTFWKKSMELKKDEFIATPRKLIEGNMKTIYALDLINSNPVIHNIKPFIKEILNKLNKKGYTTRDVSKKLNINKNNLYYNWVNEKARGNIKLNSLKQLCELAKLDYKKYVKEISLYNGKNYTIPLKISKNFMYIAGLIAGDGDIRKNEFSTSVRLSNNDEKLHSIFTKTIQKEFNLNFDTQKKNDLRPKSTRFNSKILGEILFNLGIPYSPKSNKLKFSNKLLHLSNEYLSEFISGLFDSDGSINIRKTKGSNSIEYCSCSEEFIRELQLVLLRYNIHSKIRFKEPTKEKIKGNNKRWILEIRGENIKTFAKSFKLRKESKKNKLNLLLNQKIKHNTNIDIIPNIGFEVKKLLKQKKISVKGLSSHNNYSRDYLKKIIKKYKLNELKHLCDNDIFWEKIVDIKIKKPNYEYVYDLTVEDSHNFVVDGVLVHNTAAVVRDEFLKGWSLEAGALVLANKGICVTGDTDILLNNNEIKKIKDIYKEFNKGKSFEVLSINDKNHNIEKANIKEVSKRRPEKLLEVKFNTGQTLKITPEHPVPYWDNGIIWKPIGELSKGDFIFNTNDYVNFDNKKEIYSNQMMEFAGMIATDGHISKTKNTIKYYTKDYELYSRFINIVSEEFGIIPNTYNNKRSNVLQIYFSSKEVINFLNKLGIPRGNKSKEGFSLDYIYNLNKNQVKSFLIGVINGDGCISNRISGGILNITCGNKIIAESYQKLFYKLGIISKVEKYKAKGGGIVKKRESVLFRVVITNKENLIKIKDKRLVQEKMINLYLISKRKNLSFPFIKIDKLLEEISISLPKGKKAVLYNNSIRKHKNMKNISFRKFTLKNALNKIKGNFSLKRIVNSGVYFSKIEEIKYIQPEEVYNIQTDSKFEPNYFANFIPVHNCMIDELDKMSEEDRSAMHEALEGQCYHPETEIRLSDGSRTKIAFLVETIMKNKEKVEGINCEFSFPDNLNIITTDFNQIFETKVNRISRHTPPKYFVKITFQNGRTIKVTPEHPVWVYHNGSYKEVPATMVNKDMLVPAPKNSGIVGSKQKLIIPKIEHFNENKINLPQELNEELASFLGYFITEGHSYLNNKNRYAEIGISTTCTEIKEHIIELFKTLFNIDPNINIRPKDYNKKCKKELYTIRCSSKLLYKFFKLNFSELLQKSPLKRVPNAIMKERKIIKSNFLKYSFAGDGFVDKSGFGFCTSSNKLAEDYQDLLLDLGIQSFIRKEIKENKPYFKNYISSPEGKFMFYETIVPELDHRKEKLNYFCNSSLGKANYRDPVPTDMLVKVKNILNTLHINDGYFNTLIKRNQNSQRNIVKKYISLAQNKINKINSHNQTQLISLIHPELKQISNFLESEMRLIGIKEINKIVENVPYVYDVTILPNQTFISQGVILHNTITISKANIQATLRSETTVLAAANPKFGRFDPYDSISKQIDLPPALINRFDLIFAIKDIPDRDKDEKMASFILGLHKDPTGNESEISTDLIRKYIAYSKQNMNPVLTEGAVEEIKNYYIKMRHKGSSEGEIKSIPISARQLEGLVRIAESCAKIRLSKKVSRKDAKTAVDLLHYSLTQIGVDPETGEIDIDRIATGISSSERNKIVNIREIITKLESSLGKTIPVEEIIKEASQKGMSEDKVEEAIEKLKKTGDLFEPRRGFISRI